ncbi:hypothetical protein EU527_15520 [Candidatus Thorarchaeota archaeon]|nr:MAG: hypothetical protein EU527_15520 [Candidatus Thorarchaeota archaeon]
MQLDTFFMNLIQVSLLDGLALGLGGAFIVTSFCALILTRRMGVSITRGLGAIASLVIGIISGFLVMNSIGLFATWTGSAIHGLSGTDLVSWTSLVSSTFSSYQSQAIALSYLGSLGGLGMGYGVGIRPKDEATTFGTVFSMLGVCALAIGFTLVMLPTILALSTILLFGMIGFITLLFVLFGLMQKREGSEEDSESYVMESESIV